MNPREIDRFFKIVDREFKGKADILLTGAAAGSLLGGVRPSMDVDFEVKLKDRGPKAWDRLVRAVERGKALTGVAADYSEDIDRWGSVTLLDYRKHTEPYKKIGSLTLKVLEPAYWSVGKMTRYLQPDIGDMVKVFKKRKVSTESLVRLWGRALRASPRSEALSLFRRQVEHFFRVYGPKVWGKRFEAQRAIDGFQKAAGIPEKAGPG